MQLFDLSQFDVTKTKMQLIYRGSRDGFGAADFHRQCDLKPKTLTVIQTTKGYVFGGYTQACWSSYNFSPADPNAFLFSLTNKFNKPTKFKIANPKYAISCHKSYGPCFGEFDTLADIFVSDKCNQTSESCSRLKSYQVVDDLRDPNNLYFCDDLNFTVKEIEVFEVNELRPVFKFGNF